MMDKEIVEFGNSVIENDVKMRCPSYYVPVFFYSIRTVFIHKELTGLLKFFIQTGVRIRNRNIFQNPFATP